MTQPNLQPTPDPMGPQTSSSSPTMTRSPSLMERLDEARGHAGDYDDVSYATAHAALDWLRDQADDPKRAALIERAAAEGFTLVQTTTDGGDKRTRFQPGAAAIIAAITSP